MNHKDAIKRMKLLIGAIDTHNTAYYITANPLISDYDYDMLVKELATLEKTHGQLHDSTTEQVGDDRTVGFSKVLHEVPMLSIDNTYDVESLNTRLLRMSNDQPTIKFVAEHKIDGVAVSIIYQNGKLHQASTRGNGRKGDDITNNVKRVGNIPLTIPLKRTVEVRGEIYSRIAKFNKVNERRREEGADEFANARNMCAGAIKLHDPDEVERRQLDACFYTIVDALGIGVSTHSEELSRLQSWGFDIPEGVVVGGIATMLGYAGRFKNGMVSTYPTDGAVIKIDDLKLQHAAGATRKSPNGVVAFKCEPDHAWTILNKVKWQVGRTGAVTPVGEVDTTELSGSMITYVTLHNHNILRQHDLHYGDRVDIIKAGEIIPALVGVDVAYRRTNAKRIRIPTICPVCKSKLTTGTSTLYCVNKGCPARVLESLEFFTSEKCMDITGLGPGRLKVLVDSGRVRSFMDLYLLRLDDLLQPGMFGPKIAKQIMEAIELSKGSDPVRVLTSLGIYGIGRSASTSLLDAFGSIWKIAEASSKELATVGHIGALLADTLHKYFSSSKVMGMLKRMESLGLQLEPVDLADTVDETPQLTDASPRYVVTGMVPGLSRRQLVQYLGRKGVVLANSVTKETEVLVIGDAPGQGKLRAAKKHHTKTMTGGELLEMLK